jgi:hypothetical protein
MELCDRARVAERRVAATATVGLTTIVGRIADPLADAPRLCPALTPNFRLCYGPADYS